MHTRKVAFIVALLLLISALASRRLFFFNAQPTPKISTPHYYCTAANSRYFSYLLNLIGSIHHVSFDQLDTILVADIGLSKSERRYVESIEKVVVMDLEKTHPQLIEDVVVRSDNKKVPGWYAWKPVAIKQALDRFEYVLWIDAGCTVFRPLDDLFEHVKEHGSFLVYLGENTTRNYLTEHVKKTFNLNNPERSWLLDQYDISAGFQGISRKYYDSYIMPLYKLTKDLNNFRDDGSSPLGFGFGRHDQSLFTIHARLLGLPIMAGNKEPCEALCSVRGNTIPFHITWEHHRVSQHTHVLICGGYHHYRSSLHFKKGAQPS